MAIKVKLRNGVFEPLESIEKVKKEYKDKKIQIEIMPKKNKLSWRGALKNLKISSVELQHKIKDLW